jgi:NADPH-dependent 2,4-dienoyl-CoA reductase/sulfur reductase-like enzyme
MTERVVVVGGDAAGMSAASQALRLRDDLRIVAFERGRHVSYSACGIPYWVAGDVDDDSELVARTADEHRRAGIDLRMRTEVESIDVDAGRVTARDLETGETVTEGFDQLVVATGAVPIRPRLPGVDADGVFGVQTLDDGGALLDELRRTSPRRAVVVGGGYIGVEMAEALVRHGLEVTVLDRAAEPMSTLDPDMGRLVHDAMEGLGIDVRVGTPVESFETDTGGRVRAVVTPERTFETDVVVLGIGVAPNAGLAKDAGLPVGEHGGLLTDLRMRVPGHENVWAGGDCVEVRHLVSKAMKYVPLGTHANKQGRVIGRNLGGEYATFPGVVGTAVSKVCDLEIARTGLLEKEARAAGFDFLTVTIEATTRAGYFPGAREMTVKLLAEKRTGKLLGAQIVGGEGSAKRIDVAAVALWNRMTVDDMTSLDLGYAPPFSPVWDPILVASRKALGKVHHTG